jgi:hypothetical protein
MGITTFLFVALSPIHRTLPLRQGQYINVTTFLNDKYTPNTMIDGLDCSSSWGTFLPQKSILTETQLVQRSVPPPPVDTNDTNLFEDFFIDPANNFAFCVIAKNAVSVESCSSQRHGESNVTWLFRTRL